MSNGSHRPARGPSPQAGLSLIELMVTLAITAVLVGLAVPSMHEFIARRRVAAVALELASDLRYVTSTGLQRNTPSQLDVASTCYAVSLDSTGFGPCDCNQPNPCSTGAMAPQLLKLVTLPSSSGVTFSSTRANTLFDRRGVSNSSTPVAITISSTNGGKVKVYTQGSIARSYACSLEHQENSFPACAP